MGPHPTPPEGAAPPTVTPISPLAISSQTSPHKIAHNPTNDTQNSPKEHLQNNIAHSESRSVDKTNSEHIDSPDSLPVDVPSSNSQSDARIVDLNKFSNSSNSLTSPDIEGDGLDARVDESESDSRENLVNGADEASFCTINMKQYSNENLTKNDLNEVSYATGNDRIRRSSLPEIKSNGNSSITEKDLNSISVSSLNIDPIPRCESSKSSKVVECDRSKNVDSKNLVKNMHGLFSMVGVSLKNAYKPMGDMMLATQKNLSTAKNDYLKSERVAQNDRVAQNLSKYSTLNLLNENERDEEELFKKCDKISLQDTKSSIDRRVVTEGNGDSVKVSEDFVHHNDTPMVENQDFPCISIQNENSMNVHNNLEESSSHRCNSDEISICSNEKTEILETAVSELQKEISVLKNALIDKDAIKKSLESRVNLLMKQLETLRIERDASVVRYAVSERSILEATKSKEAASAAEQSAKREASMVGQRLRTANAERTRATAALDMKCHELSMAQREIAKAKEELQSCEVKLKWAQSKLVSEMEAHKESSALAEKLSVQIKQKEGTSSVPSTQSSQSVDIESQLREKDATIILERHERERVESRCKQLQAELERLKEMFNKTSEEARELRAQVEAGSAESAALRRTCSELREQGAKDCERLAVAQARAARCDTLAVHLQQEQERSAKLVQEFEAMRVLREEALAEGELKSRREAELLRQTERLTAAGVKLQATCSEAEAKALALTVDNASLHEAATKAAAEVAEARLEVAKEREGRAADARALASRAAQHARGEREALAALEAARGEARVLGTKHASAIKELKRELQQTKRKYERLEGECRLLPQSQTHLSSERTGSCSSLSSYEGQVQQNNSNESNDILQDIQVNTPDRQQLVERIVSLQRAAARRGEKLDFMEEHNRQLTQELQRKTRLLRALLVTAPTGSLTSPASDAAKVEIGRHGGVMSSVYGSQVTDETMTLELSLEINAKLQSLLEDTLLSNITLKENMDTLGDEISRLKDSQKSSKINK